MNIGITGATGFIGELLVQKNIEMGNIVHILSRKNTFSNDKVIMHQGDLNNVESLVPFLQSLDILYHCAAEISDESMMKQTNVNGTLNLIEALKGKNLHWVQLSSVGIYGPISEGIVNENQSANPANEYEITKYASDQAVIAAANKGVFTYTIIRPSNVFGVSMRNKSIFDLVKAIDKGYYFFIGKRGASANYVTVEDVVESLILAAHNNAARNKTYIISNWCTIEEFVGVISSKLSKSIPWFRMPKSLLLVLAQLTAFMPRNPLTAGRVHALTNKTIYSTSKIERELGFKSVMSIQDGLAQLVSKYSSLKI
jgi:nucleoside-diphosphate-sugar epimerase